MCSGLHPTHTHTEIWLGGGGIYLQLGKKGGGGKKTKHILIAVRTQSKIREL